ncbi:hypothetical protein JCM11251_004446 [Rhodosporidiobolus azoricus]
MAAAETTYPPDTSARYQPINNGLEAAAIAAGSETAEEELAWARPAKRRRWDWRTGVVGLGLGVLLGAGAFHAGGKLREDDSVEDKENALQGKETVFSESLPTVRNASDVRLAPIRIHYREEPGINQRGPILFPDCPIPVVYTTDEKSADIVVLNTDSSQSLSPQEYEDGRRERPWQKHAVWGVESAPNRHALEAHFNLRREGKGNETAEFEMTYRLNSTVPATYSYSYFNYGNQPIPREEKRQDKIAAAFVTNCHPRNARTLILDELIKLLPGKIDSFGACRTNAEADATLQDMGLYDSVGTHNRWNQKITLIGYYPFTIAFENSNDLDYATEKLFQAFERGTIPLAFGAPDYAHRFFPSPNAGIDVSEYLPASYSALSNSSSEAPSELDDEAKAGLAKLAERLEYLWSEEGAEEYESMLAWKKDDRWKRDPVNPLGKIVRLSTSKYGQDCRLAGAFRGEDWAKNTWTPP